MVTWILCIAHNVRMLPASSDKKKGISIKNIKWKSNKNFKQNSNAHISIKDEGRNPRKSDSRSRRQQQEAEWAESKRKYDEWCDEHTWKKYGHELLFMEPPVGMSCKRPHHTHTPTHWLRHACMLYIAHHLNMNADLSGCLFSATVNSEQHRLQYLPQRNVMQSWNQGLKLASRICPNLERGGQLTNYVWFFVDNSSRQWQYLVNKMLCTMGYHHGCDPCIVLTTLEISMVLQHFDFVL